MTCTMLYSLMDNLWRLVRGATDVTEWWARLLEEIRLTLDTHPETAVWAITAIIVTIVHAFLLLLVVQDFRWTRRQNINSVAGIVVATDVANQSIGLAIPFLFAIGGVIRMRQTDVPPNPSLALALIVSFVLLLHMMQAILALRTRQRIIDMELAQLQREQKEGSEQDVD